VAIVSGDIQMCRVILGWPDLVIDWGFKIGERNMFHRIAENKDHDIFDLLVAHRTEDELLVIK
jgi:hypothetical protein